MTTPALSSLRVCGPVVMASATKANTAPRFSAIAYSGGLIRDPAYIRRFGQPLVVDLNGLQVPDVLAVSLNFDDTQRIGHTTSVKVEQGTLVIEGVVSGSGSAAKEVIALGAGPITATIEIEPTDQPQALPREATANINGRQATGPALVAFRSRLRGISFQKGIRETDSPVVFASAAFGYVCDVIEKSAFGLEGHIAPHELAAIKAQAIGQARNELILQRTSSPVDILAAAERFDLMNWVEAS